MQLTESQAKKIKTLMLARTQPAYLVMDRQMSLLEWSENIVLYGFESLSLGANCSDIFEFLVGYDFKKGLDLPIVTSPNNIHCSISILLEDDLAYVLIMDASKDFDQQFLLQQKANEANLLNAKQRRLMGELIATQRELEKKNLELEDASRLQRRFLSGVSHEFRTPLTSIIGYANALIGQSAEMKGEGEPDKGRDFYQAMSACQDKLRIIVNNSNYLLSLVENLLDHGSIEEQDIVIYPKAVSVGEFFASLYDMLYPIAERKGIDLLLELETVGSFQIDETKVRQCVINLVNNAIKFTEKGSVIINVDHQNDELIIAVKDTGIGMDQPELDNIYTSFWQSKRHSQAGAGLGMTITKRIMDSMGGEVSIISTLNEGTEVAISFPAYLGTDTDQTEQISDVSADSFNQKCKILLVEDDLDICELVHYYLETWGCDVQVCHNGQIALDWLEDNSADIIFLDLNMPVLDGYETLNRIKKSEVKTSVYIMSAQPLGSELELDQKLDLADGHILKPVDFRDLKSLIETTSSTTII